VYVEAAVAELVAEEPVVPAVAPGGVVFKMYDAASLPRVPVVPVVLELELLIGLPCSRQPVSVIVRDPLVLL
jgi:hypothetical protein